MTESTISAERERTRANEAFNRAADLNVTQIMERIGSLEVSVNKLQNNLMQSIVKVLTEQQEAAADRAEVMARTAMLEGRVHALQVDAQGRAQTIAGLAWGLAALCVVAGLAVIWYGAKLIGG